MGVAWDSDGFNHIWGLFFAALSIKSGRPLDMGVSDVIHIDRIEV